MGPQSTTEQPVLLGLKMDEKGNAPMDPVGPDMDSAGRGEPVCRLGLGGPQNRTEQSVFLGLDADQVRHVPASPVDPEVMMYRNQSLTDGPVGQDKTRRPVGTEGMHAVNNRPTGPPAVGRLFKLDPSDPSGMSSPDELNQPLAVGPVGQPFTTGPQGNRVRESDYRRTNQIDSGSEGSTGMLDPVNQTGKHIQTDRMKIDTVNEPASAGDSPPSSDSGVHSWGEQWENMSTNSMDGASEQTDSSTYGSSMRGHISDTRAPPNTEEEGDFDYPWADRLLSEESDGSSSNVVHRNDRRLLYNAVTEYGSGNNTANSGNVGRNSDIGLCQIFLMTWRRQEWNSCRAVEYPVVDVTGVS